MSGPKTERNRYKRQQAKQRKQLVRSSAAASEVDDYVATPQNPPSAAHRIVIQMVQMPKDEYDNMQAETAGLKNENAHLKQQLAILEGNERVLQQTIRNGEKTIEELKRENENLKQQIQRLEKDIAALKNQATAGGLKTAVSTFSVAIIDLLKGEKILDQLALNVRPYAESLKCDRINDCHYLVHEDPADVIQYKKYVLEEKLKNMDKEVKGTFDSLYPGVIDEVLLYLKTYPTGFVVVDPTIVRRVNFWWM